MLTAVCLSKKYCHWDTVTVLMAIAIKHTTFSYLIYVVGICGIYLKSLVALKPVHTVCQWFNRSAGGLDVYAL